jgi:hypothetical protein
MVKQNNRNRLILLLGLILMMLHRQRILTSHTINERLMVQMDPAVFKPVTSMSEKARRRTIIHPLSPAFAKQRILVVYSGPTSLARLEGKNELYLRNLDFFLKHGVDCQHADFVISLSESVQIAYRSQLADLDENCKASFGRSVKTLLRTPECHDLATLYALFYKSEITAEKYDYLIYLNCGLTGPSPELSSTWLQPFLEPLLGLNVSMSGLSINCFRKNKPHVMSFAYALTKEGLRIVLDSGSIFDCRKMPKHNNTFNKIVAKYEQGMSKALLQEGRGLASLFPKTVVFWRNRTQCTLRDRWTESQLREDYGGRLPHLNETLFFKSSRLLTREIKELIQYPRNATWHAV